MTISTDTQAPQTERRPRRRGPGRLEAIGVGIALAAAIGVLALTGPSGYGPGGDSAYSRPTPALHGQTLAAYVAAHEAGRLTRLP